MSMIDWYNIHRETILSIYWLVGFPVSFYILGPLLSEIVSRAQEKRRRLRPPPPLRPLPYRICTVASMDSDPEFNEFVGWWILACIVWPISLLPVIYLRITLPKE